MSGPRREDGDGFPASCPCPTTDLHESLDGGLTWQHIDTPERPWSPQAITADQVLLSSANFAVSVWGAYMFWPSVAREFPSSARKER